MTVTVVGPGLIGGSFALAMKDKGIAKKIIGVESNPEHKEKALSLGIVEEVLELNEAIEKSDLIILASPVDSIIKLLPKVLDKVNRQVVMDAGSTKEAIINAAEGHAKR